MEVVMGKHEVIKTTSTARVAKHRAEMRAKGYRLKQVWVRDCESPEFKAEIARANKAIADWERQNPDEVAWMDELTVDSWKNAPD
jgi:Protein  of unknown function (DUF3018)